MDWGFFLPKHRCPKHRNTSSVPFSPAPPFSPPSGPPQWLYPEPPAQSKFLAADEIVWAVNPKNDPLSQTIAYICQFAQDLLRSAQMRCRIDLQEPLPEHALDSGFRHNLFLVLKEALHNAARHSQGTEVRLKVSATTDSICFVVEDDGIGLNPSAKISGDGMDNMRRRANSIGANIHFTARPGGGTCVTIAAPLK